MSFATPFTARRREKSKFSAENYASRANDIIPQFIFMKIEKLTKLARINLSSEEKGKLQKEFEVILNYISALKEADTGDGRPIFVSQRPYKNGSTLVVENGFSKRETLNVMRLDENVHEMGKFTKDLLEGVPFSENGYVKVKHVFEN